MNEISTSHGISTVSCCAPRLIALGLSDKDLRALKQQGFISVEYRGHRGPFFKLRYRVEGRQFVKYLGSNPQEADHIRNELAALQADHHLMQELQRLTVEASGVLRSAKRGLKSQLLHAGYAFHGFTIRRTLEHASGKAEF